MVQDKKPDKQPRTMDYAGCPPTKYRHPNIVGVSGGFKDLEELTAEYKDDIDSLSLDMSKVFDALTKRKRVILGFSGSYEGAPKINFRYIEFDSSKYSNFVRLYKGKAKFQDYEISQYEVSISDRGFMIVFYLSKDGNNYFLLRTNDQEYVKSHSDIEWWECTASELGKLISIQKV
jgi:hypothetical protein